MDSYDVIDTIAIIVVAIIVMAGILLFANVWAGNRPYSYTAKYCAGSVCDTMSQEGLTEKNECPKTRAVQVAAFSDLNGELVEGTCKVWKR